VFRVHTQSLHQFDNYGLPSQMLLQLLRIMPHIAAATIFAISVAMLRQAGCARCS
jgi:hypothetical protein